MMLVRRFWLDLVVLEWVEIGNLCQRMIVGNTAFLQQELLAIIGTLRPDIVEVEDA